MENINQLKKEIEELKKGCGGKWSESSVSGGYKEYFKCGWDKKLKVHWRCDRCDQKLEILKAKLQTLQEVCEEIKMNLKDCRGKLNWTKSSKLTKANLSGMILVLEELLKKFQGEEE